MEKLDKAIKCTGALAVGFGAAELLAFLFACWMAAQVLAALFFAALAAAVACAVVRERKRGGE